MKQVRFAVMLLFVVSCMIGCGLKDRRVEQIQIQHPDWDSAMVQAVAGRQVQIGMNRQMVMTALGNPDSITHEGEEEKWAYGINRVRDMGAIVRVPVFWVFFRGEAVVRTEGDWKKLGYGFYNW